MLNEIADKIKDAGSIVIVAHKNLDGDALGAMLAMGHFIKNEFGKTPVLAFEGVIPDNLRWMTGGWWLKKAEAVKENVYDLMFLLDTGADGTLLDDEAKAVWAGAKFKIKIDHHQNSKPEGDINLLEPVAAVCETITRMAGEIGWTITREIARFLYTGIFWDTGGFVHSYTTPDTMRAAAMLMDAGANPHEVARKLSEKPKETFLNNSETLARTLFSDDGKIGYTTFSVKKINETDRPHRETKWLHQQILCVKELEASVIFKDTDDGRIQVSIRSKAKPINTFAEQFGGGGHQQAAAFSFEGTLTDAVVQAIPKLNAFLNESIKI